MVFEFAQDPEPIGSKTSVTNTLGEELLGVTVPFLGATINVTPPPGVDMFMVQDPAPADIQVGSFGDFQVWVNPNGIGDIAGAQFSISYDPAVLEVAGITETGTTLPLTVPPVIDNAAGIALFAAFNTTPLAASQAAFPFATVTFKAKTLPPAGATTDVVFEFALDPEPIGSKTSVTNTLGDELLGVTGPFLGTRIVIKPPPVGVWNAQLAISGEISGNGLVGGVDLDFGVHPDALGTLDVFDQMWIDVGQQLVYYFPAGPNLLTRSKIPPADVMEWPLFLQANASFSFVPRVVNVSMIPSLGQVPGDVEVLLLDGLTRDPIANLRDGPVPLTMVILPFSPNPPKDGV